MNYFDFGRYKYRDVFETAKPAENFVLARPALPAGFAGPSFSFFPAAEGCPAAVSGITKHNSPLPP